MPSQAVVCPQCRASLRSARPVPDHRTVRCPQCGVHFVASADKLGPARGPATPPPLPPLTVPPPPAAFSRRAFLPAVVGAVLLFLVVAAGAAWLLHARPESPPDVQAVAAWASPEGADRPLTARQLEEERKKLDEERAHLEMEKRRLEFDRLMARGDAALAGHRPEDAQQAYRAALRLFPEDAKALAGLAEAKAAALAGAATARRDREEHQKRRAEVDRLLGQAREAMGKKEYAAAVRALEGARQLTPGDAAVTKALGEAQAALDKDAAEKKKLAEYQAHMDAGKAHFDAQRYADAVREFLAAQRALPGDGDALLQQRAAENQLAALQDFDKRVAAHKELMSQAQAALDARRYADAVKALTMALRLFPDDQQTQKGLKAARQALADARKERDQLLDQADAALQAQRWEEAHRLFTRAAELMPDDPTALRGQQAAADALQNLRVGQAAYTRFLIQGQDALLARRFADAVRAFREALRLVPGDPAAAQGLRDAEAGLAQALRQKAAFDRAMQAGAAALQQEQFADAARAFNDALRIAPDSFEAQAGLRQARYGQAMADGRQALRARRVQEAIGHFQDALQQVPGDPAATAALRQAQAMKR
jgi:tetratricopeptide (TPR) repeat protein